MNYIKSLKILCEQGLKSGVDMRAEIKKNNLLIVFIVCD